MLSTRILNPKLALGMAVWGLFLGVSPGKAVAIPSESVSSFQAASERDARIAQILQALSRPQAQLHLRASGIDQGKLKERLARLDDSQLASLAEKAEAVQAGGVLGVVIAVLVIAILVIILLYLLDDKEIEVKDAD